MLRISSSDAQQTNKQTTDSLFQSQTLGVPEPEDSACDTRDAYGQTSLHKAAFEGNLKQVENLVTNQKANINAVDRNGWTPLHCSTSQNHVSITSFLMHQPNIDVTIPSRDGTLAFHYFMRSAVKEEGDYTEFDFILDMFMETLNLDTPGRYGETALHQAISRSNVFTTEWLLSHGADPNVKSGFGDLLLSIFSSRSSLLFSSRSSLLFSIFSSR